MQRIDEQLGRVFHHRAVNQMLKAKKAGWRTVVLLGSRAILLVVLVVFIIGALRPKDAQQASKGAQAGGQVAKQEKFTSKQGNVEISHELRSPAADVSFNGAPAFALGFSRSWVTYRGKENRLVGEPGDGWFTWADEVAPTVTNHQGQQKIRFMWKKEGADPSLLGVEVDIPPDKPELTVNVFGTFQSPAALEHAQYAFNHSREYDLLGLDGVLYPRSGTSERQEWDLRQPTFKGGGQVALADKAANLSLWIDTSQAVYVRNIFPAVATVVHVPPAPSAEGGSRNEVIFRPMRLSFAPGYPTPNAAAPAGGNPQQASR